LPPNPHQLIESTVMRDLLASVRTRYDIVIIDSPPLLPVSDAAVLATMADGVIAVVGCKRVRRQQLRQALRSLDAVSARILGIVLTFAPRSGADGEFYGYRADTRRRFPFSRAREESALGTELTALPESGRSRERDDASRAS
jgi:succinoglycan biosynthesis transport protein ExoP